MLLQAERLFHLEALVEAEDEGETRDHRFIARWIKHFLEAIPDKVEAAYKYIEEEAKGEHENPTAGGGSPYMEGDGDPEEPLEDPGAAT